MNKIIFTILLFAVSLTISAQEEYRFFNEDGNSISSEEFFKQNRTKKTTYGYVASDSIITFRVVQRESIGKLGSKQFDELKKLVSLPSDRDFWIFIYYPGIDACNQSARMMHFERDDFPDKIKKLGNSETYYFAKYLDTNLKRKKHTGNDWQLDPELYFERTFFDKHYPCFSFVILKPDGNFILHRAEFGDATLLEAAKKLM